MFRGKVVGTVWATKKVENLKNLRFLLVQPVDIEKEETKSIVVAADPLGAGPGELVLVSFGRAARLACGNENISIEAAVVGIIDSIEMNRLAFKNAVETFDEIKKRLEERGVKIDETGNS